MTSSKVKHPLISRFSGAADANAGDMDRETGGPGGPLWAFYNTEKGPSYQTNLPRKAVDECPRLGHEILDFFQFRDSSYIFHWAFQTS
jgi:hypothetical protein